ncbi:MAG: hypothetical protein ACI85E_000991 [Marinomonas primoryensis]|jgi:hypothetical protein
MKQTKNKPVGGGKLNRTQTVTMRLDPHLRYLTDLAARSQRRTTSGFIEWAIGEALHKVVMRTYEGSPDVVTLGDEAYNLWDVDESDRFVKLAINYPHLLTYEEQVIWKIIRKNGAFWSKGDASSVDASGFDMIGNIAFVTIKKYWDVINLVANGEKDADSLPEYDFNAGAHPNDAPF